MLDDAALLFTGISLILTGVCLMATCIAIAAARRSRRTLNEMRARLQGEAPKAPTKSRRRGRVA